MSILKSKMVKFCIAEVLLAVIIIMIYLYYKNQQNHSIYFEPFAISASGLTLKTIPSAPVMEGTTEGDLMIAAPSGSKIFAKGGLNYMVANEGEDEFFFSLCSTKIIDNKVSVIEGFNPKQDKLKIFCGHHLVKLEDLKIMHSNFHNKEITYVFIKGEHTDTAIALLENINLKTTDIILNERWNQQNHN